MQHKCHGPVKTSNEMTLLKGKNDEVGIAGKHSLNDKMQQRALHITQKSADAYEKCEKEKS